MRVPSADALRMSHTAITIHEPSRFEGYHCPWHNPSDHHMNAWTRRILMDRHNLIERVCRHEVGHRIPTRSSGSIALGSTTTARMSAMAVAARLEPRRP
jgi:hypothetical protein